jgi:hypothetical protein
MQHEMGAVVLASLSVVFTLYGIWELALAYQSTAWRAWGEKALQGAAAMCVAFVFAGMTLQLLG